MHACLISTAASAMQSCTSRRHLGSAASACSDVSLACAIERRRGAGGGSCGRRGCGEAEDGTCAAAAPATPLHAALRVAWEPHARRDAATQQRWPAAAETPLRTPPIAASPASWPPLAVERASTPASERRHCSCCSHDAGIAIELWRVGEAAGGRARELRGGAARDLIWLFPRTEAALGPRRIYLSLARRAPPPTSSSSSSRSHASPAARARQGLPAPGRHAGAEAPGARPQAQHRRGDGAHRDGAAGAHPRRRAQRRTADAARQDAPRPRPCAAGRAGAAA